MCHTAVVGSSEIIRALTENGLSHGELAARAGVARETLSRWATGANRPSLEALQDVASAAGFELDVQLRAPEPKLVALADDQLALSPTDRVRALLGDDWAACHDALHAAASSGALTVLVGPVAAAIDGAPQRPGTGRVDLLVPLADHEQTVTQLLDGGANPDGFEHAAGADDKRERWIAGRGTLTLRTTATGIEDIAALRDRGQRVTLTANTAGMRVARAEDLLRISVCSPWSDDALYRAGLRAVLASGRYSARQQPAGLLELA